MTTGNQTWQYSTIDNQLFWATRMDQLHGTGYRYAAEELERDQEP
jgi:hypothetical protein